MLSLPKRSSIQLKSFLFLFYALLLFSVLIVIFGLVPGKNINSLGASYAILANTKALVNHGLISFSFPQNMGYPLGFPFLTGLPFVYFSGILCVVFSLGTYFANILTGVLFLSVGFLAGVFFLKKIHVNNLISITFSFIFLSFYFVYGQSGYQYMMYGFILLPFYILCDCIFFEKFTEIFDKNHAPKIFQLIKYLLFFVIVKAFSLFMDGYSFVMSAAFSFSYLLFFILENRRSPQLIFTTTAIHLLSYFSAIVLYKIYVPGGAQYEVVQADFFRAQGVDLISLFLPGKDLLYAKILGIEHIWNGLAYYGDGSNVKYNYLGYILICCCTGCFLVKISKTSVLKALILSGSIAFVISLGPSIKFDNHKVFADKNQITTFNDYLMPESKALFNLQTDILYQKIPGLNNMRAVSRWLLLFKFLVVIAAALFINYLVEKKLVKLASLLVILMVVEIFPDIGARYQISSSFYRQLRLFDESVVSPISQYVHSGEKIMFLSSDNDFLANYISTELNARSYNCGIDKNLAFAYKQWPSEIVSIREGVDVNEKAYQIMKKDGLDKLIVPYFNLRWHSYYWPPDQSALAKTKKDRLALLNIEDKRFVYEEEKWFGVLRLNHRP